MPKHKKKWSELTREQRVMVIVTGIVQTVLLALVQRDLSRRSADDLRGGKVFWRLAAFVQPAGPIAYFLIGRRRRPQT